MHAAGITGGLDEPAGLARSRRALLDFIARVLGPEESRRTVVVFDAAGAPPGLPMEAEHRGLAVRFSEKTSDADSVLEKLIGEHSSPRRLTVVSSDHRVQRAARRRRARAVDSEAWYVEMKARFKTPTAERPDEGTTSRPSVRGREELEWWLAQFAFGESEASDDIFPPGFADDLPV